MTSVLACSRGASGEPHETSGGTCAFALHGYMSGPDDFFVQSSWQRLADELSIAVISVSATIPRAPDKFRWSEETSRDLAHLDRALGDVRSVVQIDPSHVTLIGFSQGADVAYRIFVSHPERFRGVVSMSPGNIGHATLEHLEIPSLRGKTVVVTVGADEDPFLIALSRASARLAEERGAVAQLRIVEHQGHTFARDLGSVLPAWLSMIDGAFSRQ